MDLYAYYEELATGSTDTFTIPFSYISKDHLKVTVAGTVSAFTIVNGGGQYKLPSIPLAGSLVSVQRSSSPDSPLVVYSDGNLSEESLNTSTLQTLFLVQEAADDGSRATKVAADAMSISTVAHAAASEAQAEAASATSTANSALAQAASAVVTAGSADTKATAALASAGTAVSTASSALNTAEDALDAASDAVATANAAATTAASASAAATTANAKATTALSTANSASDTAGTASTNAAAAVAAASSAGAKADTAISTANAASSSAATAVVTADEAKGDATEAVVSASSALSAANTAATNSASALSTANSASATANNAATDAATALTTASAADTKADTAIATADAASALASSAQAAAEQSAELAQDLADSVSVHTAADLTYDASGTGLAATNVQQAVDLIAAATGVIDLSSDGVTNASSVSGSTVSDALDALAAVDGTKAPLGHTHDDRYFTEAEVTAALATKLDTSMRGAANGVASLGSDGLVPVAQLPATVITDVHEVSSEAAMLALSAQQGDIAIRSDLNKTFVLAAAPSATAGNWKELRTPTDAVLSVAGRTGAVTLTKSDVGLGSVDNTTDAAKPISTATQTALNLKAPLASPGLTGAPTAPTATAGSNTLQIANTAFVQGELAGKQPLAAPLTALSGLTIAKGSLIVGTGASALGVISGAAGQVPTVQADGSVAMASPVVAGWSLLGSWTYASAVSQVVFTGLAGYDNILVSLTGVSASQWAVVLNIYESSDDGASWSSGVGAYDLGASDVLSTFNFLGLAMSSAQARSVYLLVGSSVSLFPADARRAVNALKVAPSAGDLDAGSVQVYGRR